MLEIPSFTSIPKKTTPEVSINLFIGINVNIYPSFGKSQYQVVDGIYLHIDSKQFADGTVVLVVITP